VEALVSALVEIGNDAVSIDRNDDIGITFNQPL
jgi:hypothetical protein